MPPRRFPPPWSVEETDACFIVRDANGQALAYVYFEDGSHLYSWQSLTVRAPLAWRLQCSDWWFSSFWA
jgi:hypothetical protein